MSEKIGSYSFEKHGEKNPYDKFFIANQLTKDVVATLNVRKQYIEEANDELIHSQAMSSVALLDEDFGELVAEIMNRELEVTDPLLREYIDIEHYTIDDERYSPESQIPFIKILKHIGYPEEAVVEYYDFTNSTLPEEHMSKSIATMELVRKIYGED